jgi:hypothetical protein
VAGVPKAAILREIEGYPSVSQDAIRENFTEVNNYRAVRKFAPASLASLDSIFGDTQPDQPELSHQPD